MRIWSIHPRYLDPQGLVALWREALLARTVLRGETGGYRNHPQLNRFRNHPAPQSAITLYLKAVYAEARSRGYNFDKSKLGTARKRVVLTVTGGQIAYEWTHLMKKLRRRNPSYYRKWKNIRMPDLHPLFRARAGGVESWERQRGITREPPSW